MSISDKGSGPIPFTAAGLAPGQAVIATLVIDNVPSGNVTAAADPSGNATAGITWTTTFGLKPLGDVPAVINLTDAATGASIASTPVIVGNAGFSVDKGLKKLSAKRTWKVSGLSALTGGGAYYAYYFKPSDLKKNNFKVIGKQKLGSPTGACGYLKAKKPLQPFKKTGSYVVVIESSAKFDAQAPGIVGAIKSTLRKS